jgi:hypothetical protein
VCYREILRVWNVTKYFKLIFLINTVKFLFDNRVVTLSVRWSAYRGRREGI